MLKGLASNAYLVVLNNSVVSTQLPSLITTNSLAS